MSLDGQTTNLPPVDVIDAGVASMEADVADMFGLSDSSSSGGTPPASPSAEPAIVTPPEPAGAGGIQAPTPPAGETPPAAPAATPAAPASAEPTPPAATPPGAAPAVAAPTAPPPPAPTEEALRAQSLEAQVQALSLELQTLRASPQGTAPAAPVNENGQPAEPLPAYSLSLPPPVAEALTSEDPQRMVAAVTHMMNSLATIVHANVRQELNGRIQQAMTSVAEQGSTEARAQAINEGREQYYSAFPDHRDPLVSPLLQAEARDMSAQFPGLKWDANYIAALGQRVNNRIAAFRGTPPVVPLAPVVPPAAPAASIPTGTRPGMQELDGGDLIADTFS